MITNVDVVGREIPYAESFPTSYDDQSPTQHVFVRVQTEKTTGYGEGSALKWFTGDTAGTMASIARSEFVPAIEGKSVSDALGACRELADRLPGNPGASAGVEMSMISQSAMNGLDPVYRVKDQIREAIQEHRDMSDQESYERARELMELVGLDADRVEDYPHQLSGGMRQRVIIAMTLALDPDFIIADEPTTALDVIIQEQILYRIKELQQELGNSMMMVTHDISVVAETCDSMVVIHGGELMEAGNVDEIFNNAHHPYTLGLQNAFPSVEGEKRDLTSIPGSPPDLTEPLEGCPSRLAARSRPTSVERHSPPRNR